MNAKSRSVDCPRAAEARTRVPASGHSRRLLVLGLAATLGLGAGATVPAPAAAGPLEDVEHALDALEFDRATDLLGLLAPRTAAFSRARIALYRGDCEAATEAMSALNPATDGELSLYSLATSCYGATAGAPLLVDGERDIVLRFQDEGDRALAPRLFEVADAVRRDLVGELGVVLPAPIRIDVVRDHFSLSAMTGLPLKAAETTGTVGIARFGRVVLLSPRAPGDGYAWEDTLAHELVHVAVTHASADRAPLWLQEGLAKRTERRWRADRLFEDPIVADERARLAMQDGTSVGIDRIGPSVAMLPSANAAQISFAEVRSFVDYFVRENGAPALRLLLAELRQNSVDVALTSVTGFPLAYWNARWQRWLKSAVEPLTERAVDHSGAPEAARRYRLGELLLAEGEYQAALEELRDAEAETAERPESRRLLAESLTALGANEDAAAAALDIRGVEHPSAAWLAIHARHLEANGNSTRARAALAQARSVDPYEPRACQETPAEDAATTLFREAVCAERDVRRPQ